MPDLRLLFAVSKGNVYADGTATYELTSAFDKPPTTDLVGADDIDELVDSGLVEFDHNDWCRITDTGQKMLREAKTDATP